MNQLHLQFKKAAGGGVGGLDLHLEHEGDPFMCVSSTLTKETPPCSLLPTPPASTHTAAGFQGNQVTAGLQGAERVRPVLRGDPGGQRSPMAWDLSRGGGGQVTNGGTDSPGHSSLLLC